MSTKNRIRGRYSRDFFSPSGGGVYMSIVLRPEAMHFKNPTAVTDFESGGLDWVVLGIGINVYTPTEDFPSDLQPLATSIYLEKNENGEIITLSSGEIRI